MLFSYWLNKKYSMCLFLNAKWITKRIRKEWPFNECVNGRNSYIDCIIFALLYYYERSRFCIRSSWHLLQSAQASPLLKAAHWRASMSAASVTHRRATSIIVWMLVWSYAWIARLLLDEQTSEESSRIRHTVTSLSFIHLCVSVFAVSLYFIWNLQFSGSKKALWIIVSLK